MRHYQCVPLDEMATWSVPAAPNSLMFMWATAPMTPHALYLLQAWGFRYVSQMVWTKSRIGTGFWVRNRHELVLIGKRGKFPCPRPAPFADSVIEAPTGRHSEKPEALQDIIDSTWPEARKLEMFARRQRPGWSHHGNEVEEGIEVQ